MHDHGHWGLLRHTVCVFTSPSLPYYTAWRQSHMSVSCLSKAALDSTVGDNQTRYLLIAMLKARKCDAGVTPAADPEICERGSSPSPSSSSFSILRSFPFLEVCPLNQLEGSRGAL